MNPEVRYLLHNFKEKIKDFTLIFITNTTINLYLDPLTIPSQLKQFPRANKADFYRMQLLYQYGGLWMDSTTYLKNDSLVEECYHDLMEAKADLLAYNSWWHPAYHIELCFMMAPRGSPLLEKVLNEFKVMVSTGAAAYMENNIKGGIIIKSPIVYTPPTKTAPAHYDTYFAPYVCMQTVVQRVYNGNPNAVLRKSEDELYKLQDSCKWDSRCIAKEWMTNPEIQEYPIVKFHSGSRGRVVFPAVEII